MDDQDLSDYGFIYPAGDGPTGSSIDLVFDQVVARIEPITRFDRRSLSRQGGMERVAFGVARLRSDISITTQGRSGTGALPSGPVVVAGSSALGGEVQQTVNGAWAGMQGRIDTWLAHYGNSDRELSADDCFTGPAAFGYQYQCASCSGQGKTQCSSCSGAGEYRCAPCGGDGEDRCFPCGGQGFQQCSSCGGTGTRMVQNQRQVFNSATNSYDTEYYTEQQRCPSCGADGKVRCTSCGGSGRTTCSTCFGSGKQRCSSCNGSGHKRCDPCGGTGQRHEIQQITCTVTHRFTVALDDRSDEVQTRLRALPLAELASIGQITVDAPGRGRDFLERRYRFHVDIAELTVGVAGREVELTGFGKAATVYDFRNIAGLLLQADLAQLEGQLAKEPKFAMQRSPELKEAVKQCLDSEANAVVGQAPSSDPKALKGLVDRQYAGALSVEYAMGVSAALRTALNRLFFPAMLLPAASVTLAPAVLYLVSQLTDWGMINREASAAAAVVVGVVVWIIVEREVRKGFTTTFGPGHAKLVDRLLGKRGVVGRWRVGVGVVALAVLALVASFIK